MAGVSSFQVHFADHDILTPGDAPDVLVAMNPAALRANLSDVEPGATVIVEQPTTSPTGTCRRPATRSTRSTTAR